MKTQELEVHRERYYVMHTIMRDSRKVTDTVKVAWFVSKDRAFEYARKKNFGSLIECTVFDTQTGKRNESLRDDGWY